MCLVYDEDQGKKYMGKGQIYYYKKARDYNTMFLHLKKEVYYNINFKKEQQLYITPCLL